MLSSYLRHAAFASTILSVATAQDSKSKIVPQELQSAFSSSTEVQVSYTNDAVDGFGDGTTFEKDAVSKEPTFALGDSSGVSTTRRYTILMVDTTCDTRILHYARTNFKYTGEIVNIASETDPVLAYKEPGGFGEAGDDRQYSFLMYGQPENDEIDTLKLPTEGEAFDFGKFQDDNGFEDPQAGVGMVIKLGGQSNCGSEGTPSTPQSSSAPQSSGAAAPASSSAAQEQPSATPSQTPSPSQATSVAASPTSSQADAPQATGRISSAQSAAESATSTGAVASGRTTDLAPASSAAPSTLVLSSVVPSASASGTSTGAPAEQTASGANALSWQSGGFAMAGSVFALVGLLV